MSKQSRSSAWWVWVNIALIACSALLILSPLARSVPVRLAFGMVIAPIYFFMLVRQTRKSGRGDVPLSQLHAKVQTGPRVPTAALELAATVAFLLATFDPFKG